MCKWLLKQFDRFVVFLKRKTRPNNLNVNFWLLKITESRSTLFTKDDEASNQPKVLKMAEDQRTFNSEPVKITVSQNWRNM